MKYPIVYNKFETAFTGYGLAVLQKAQNVKIREVINGEYLLSFVLPRDDPKWQYLQGDNFVIVDGQKFRVRYFDEKRDSSGKLTSNIQCEHVWYDANNCAYFPKFEHIGKTPQQILTAAFANTRFTIGTVEITTLTDIQLSKAYPAQITHKLISNVGGELIRDNWTINLVQRRGRNNAFVFRSDKNLQSIRKETDYRNLTTRLFPYGKDDMDISSANNGIAYIDSPLANNYDRFHISDKDYKDVDDPAELKANASAEWSTTSKDGIDKPRITYSADILELNKLKEFGDIESFQLGDTGRMYDPGIEVDTIQRIVEYERYPYEPKQSVISLANYDINIYRKNNLAGMLGGFVQNQQAFEQITTDQGEINAFWLENIRSKIQTEINSMAQNALMHSQADVYVDNLSNPTKALILGPGLFAIANSKKSNGDWNWRTLGTGDKFISDEVNVNWLRAQEIYAEQIVAGYIKGELWTNILHVKSDEGYTPYISMELMDEEQPEWLKIFIMPHYFNNTPEVEFVAEDLFTKANLTCGNVNGYSIPGSFALSGHEHSEYCTYAHSHAAYVENGGGQSLRLQVFNGKLEIWQSGSIIGTITLD